MMMRQFWATFVNEANFLSAQSLKYLRKQVSTLGVTLRTLDPRRDNGESATEKGQRISA